MPEPSHSAACCEQITGDQLPSIEEYQLVGSAYPRQQLPKCTNCWHCTHLSLHKPCIFFKAIATTGTNEQATFVGTALKSDKGLTEAQMNKVQQLVEWHARGSDIPAAAQPTTLLSVAKAASKTAAKPTGRALTAATNAAQPVVVPQVSSSNQPQTAPTAATKPWWSTECKQMEDQGDPPGECNSLASHM
ncbi:TPA: hypothetical protein ACH3X3_011733 [Trebouxia sp. C0006]